MQPIVSSINSVSYDEVMYLAEVIQPIVGSTDRHGVNTCDFKSEILQVISK